MYYSTDGLVRDVVIFDIDGTLANCHHRLPHIKKEKPDWLAFEAEGHNDTPIPNLIRLMEIIAIDPFVHIIILTGRADRNNVREDTKAWLDKFSMAGLYNKLLMRKGHDFRPASVVKLEILKKEGFTPDRVITMFEDDPKSIEAFRAAGYHVCNVDNRQMTDVDTPPIAI